MQGASVSAELVVKTRDGGIFGGNVPYSFRETGGFLSATNDTFRTVLQLGQTDGEDVLVAGWRDGGPSATRTIQTDSVGPVIKLNIGDGGWNQRDAIIFATISSNEPLADAGLQVGDAIIPRVGTELCPGAEDEFCFEVDLSRPTFNAFDGGIRATATAIDLAGNSVTNPASELVYISRTRWRLPLSVREYPQSMAVGQDGSIYVGTIDAASGGVSGRIVKISTDGMIVGSSSNLGFVVAVAVDGPPGPLMDTVFYAALGQYRAGIGALHADSMSKGTGSEFFERDCEGANGGRVNSAFALHHSDGITYAVGALNSVAEYPNSGQLCFFDPREISYSNSTGTLVDSASLNDFPSNPFPVVNAVIRGDRGYFTRRDSSGTWIQPVQLNGSQIPVPDAGDAIQISSSQSSRLGNQVGFAGGVLITGSNETGQKLFSYPSGSQTDFGWGYEKGMPSIASATEAYLGTGGSVHQFNPSSLSTPSRRILGNPLVVSLSAPLLCAARSEHEQSIGYALASGRIAAFSIGTTPTELWRSPVIGYSPTHPAFDCNRKRLESKTGIVYFAAADGAVTAVVVDSPRLLDTPGAWPKYQRTQGNAGNDSTDFPINWPACQ